MTAAPWQTLVQVLFLCGAAHANSGTVSGDGSTWDAIFASRRMEEVLSIPAPSWPEGPQTWNGGIIFSDTIKNRIYRYDRRFGVRVFLDNSGAPLPSAAEWMAEPGSNGIAIDPERGNTAYVCQHGQHGISKLDLQTKEMIPITTHFEGKRLNGPNDLAVDTAAEFLYFTDPIYAYLRKDMFYDAAYLDDACSENLGFKGVYRLSLAGPPWDLQAIDRERNPRPNGIALSPDGSYLYVSNCCQGDHLPNCSQGTVNYNVYKLGRTPEQARFIRAITFSIEGGSGKRGCADGFKVHQSTGYIVGSCASGICIVGTGVPPARERASVASHRRSLLSVEDEGQDEEEDGEDAADVFEARKGAINGVEEGHGTALAGEEEAAVDEYDGDADSTPAKSNGYVQPLTPEENTENDAKEMPAEEDGAHSTGTPKDVRLERSGSATKKPIKVPADANRSTARKPKETPDKERAERQKNLEQATARETESGTAHREPRAAPQRANGSSSPTGARSASEKPAGKVGLIARLELDHKVSNVVFGDDGFLYATGESRSIGGGGALWRIPLRQESPSSDGQHDELR